MLTVPTTFNVSAASPPTDKPIIRFDIRDGGSFAFTSTRTSLHTGTFTAVTALDRASNVPWSVTDSAIADWTPYEGKLGVITAGARAGAIFGVALRTSAKVARISPLVTYPADGSGVTLVTPTTGDAYEIFDLPVVSFTSFAVTGGELLYYNTIENLDVQGETAGTQLSIGGNHNCYITLNACIVTNATPSGPTVTFQASKIAGTLTQVMDGFVSYDACLHVGSVYAHGGFTSFRYDTMAQGCVLFVARGGNVATNDCCAFDSDSYGVRATRGGVVECKPGIIYGSGNATYGLQCDSAAFTYTSKPTITGTSGDALIGGTPKAWSAVPYVDLAIPSSVGISGTSTGVGLTTGHLDLGATVASAGDLRLAATGSIKALNGSAADVNVASIAAGVLTYGDAVNDGLVLNTKSAGSIIAQVAGTAVLTLAAALVTVAQPLSLGAAGVTWASTVTAPTISQALHATVGQALTVQAQNVTTGTGGALALTSGTGSVAAGNVTLATGGTTAITVAPSLVTLVPALSLTAAGVTWLTGTSAPIVSQADNAVNSATAQALTIQAQNATGTTATGGALNLTSGTGTTIAGSVVLKTGGTAQLTLSPTLATFAGSIVLAGTSPATTGLIRVPKGTQSIMYGARVSDGANLPIITVSSNTMSFCGYDGVVLDVNGGQQFSVSATQLLATLPHTYKQNVASANTLLTQDTRTTDAATSTLTVQAQSAFASATGANLNGGTLQLQGGARGTASGTMGGVKVQWNASTTQNAIEVGEMVAGGRRFVALCGLAAMTTTNLPALSGDGVVAIAAAQIVPTAATSAVSLLFGQGATTAASLFAYDGLGTTTPVTRQIAAKSGAAGTYTTVATDHTLYITPSGAGYTVSLMASAPLGQEVTIADVAGTADVSPITVNVSGAGVLIDGAATFTIGKWGSYTFRKTAGIWKVDVAGTLPVAQGGTGIASYAAGDLVYASAATTLSKLAKGTVDGGVLLSGTTPAWSTAVVQSSGRLFVLNGITVAQVGTADANASAYFASAGSAVYTSVRARAHAGANSQGPSFIGEKARGTAASPTAALADDDLAYFAGLGYGATAIGTATAGILLRSAETWTDSAQGSYALALVTPVGSATHVVRMMIGSDGKVGISDNSAFTTQATTPGFLVHGSTDANASAFLVDQFFDGAGSASFISRKARGTFAAPRRAQSGDDLAAMFSRPWHAADDSSAATASSTNNAAIKFVAAEAMRNNAPTNGFGSIITFATTPVGAVGRVESYRITSDGILQWSIAGNVVTVVGAAGGASAPPATPTKYLKVKGSDGTTYHVPAYTSA